MNGLQVLVLLGGYLVFFAALWAGQRVGLQAQVARVAFALNASSVAWSCAVAADLGRSDLTVFFWPSDALPPCPAYSGWRAWVVPRVS